MRAANMNALVERVTQRRVNTTTVRSTTHARHRERDPFEEATASCWAASDSAGSRRRCGRGDDHDIFQRRVLIALAAPGAHPGDLVDDVHALGDRAEHRVAVVARAVVEEVVVRPG